MGKRIDFQTLLESILGSKNVYFQPPSTIKLSYPCIVYELADLKTKKANNNTYKLDTSYKVTLIHKNPDNDVKEKMLYLPKSKFNTSYTSENLNHYVYTIYY